MRMTGRARRVAAERDGAGMRLHHVGD